MDPLKFQMELKRRVLCHHVITY